MAVNDMKNCIALNRDVSPSKCEMIQSDLPDKFCNGCSWFKNKYILGKKLLKQEKVTPLYPKKVYGGIKRRKSILGSKSFRVTVPDYMRVWLKKEKRSKGFWSVNHVILDILRNHIGTIQEARGVKNYDGFKR